MEVQSGVRGQGSGNLHRMWKPLEMSSGGRSQRWPEGGRRGNSVLRLLRAAAVQEGAAVLGEQSHAWQVDKGQRRNTLRTSPFSPSHLLPWPPIGWTHRKPEGKGQRMPQGHRAERGRAGSNEWGGMLRGEAAASTCASRARATACRALRPWDGFPLRLSFLRGSLALLACFILVESETEIKLNLLMC